MAKIMALLSEEKLLFSMIFRAAAFAFNRLVLLWGINSISSAEYTFILAYILWLSK